MKIKTNCPVIKEANDILDCTQSIARQLRHFKTSVKRCKNCDQDGSCEALGLVNSSIDTAIRELMEEWGI